MSHFPSSSSVSDAGGAVTQRQAVIAIGLFCGALGAAALAGWYLHLPALVQLRPGMAPMQFNTALCFVLTGIALALSQYAHRAVPYLAGVVSLFGGLTLAEYICRCDFHIDQLLFRSYIITETSHAGRMSPISALSFALTGLCLVLFSRPVTPRWRPAVIGSIASVIFSVSCVAMLGYGIGLPGTYGWGEFTRVAIHTAIGLAFLSAGLFIIAWQDGVRPGEHTPRWLPIPLAIGVFTGSLILCIALDAKQEQGIIQIVRAGAESVSNQIQVRMDARSRSLVRMASRWEYSGRPSQAAWENDAANYVRDFPDLQALEWIDPANQIQWVVPLVGNEGKLHRNLVTEPARAAAMEQAYKKHRPVITSIVTLYHGGLGFIMYVPIMINGQSDGCIAAVFDARACMDRYLPRAVAAGEAISMSEGGRQFYARDGTHPSRREDWVDREKIDLHGATWVMAMWPSPELASWLDSPLPLVCLCVGALGSLLLATVCLYAQRSSRHAAATLRANAALQAALDKVKTLEGLLPICSYCKRVRDDTGYWSQIDTYLHAHTNASLSHGYCPECAAKAFQDFGFDVPEEVQAELRAGNFE